jgi:hypothetical protein
MSDEKQPIRIAASSTSNELRSFPKSSALENLLATSVSSWFARGADKSERRQTLITYTVAPALRGGRGLKHAAASRSRSARLRSARSSGRARIETMLA